MSRSKILWAVLLAGLCVSSCASVSTNLHLHLQNSDIDIRKFLRDHPIPKGQDKRVDLLASGPTASVHLVQLRTSEPPHIHARHDLRAVMVRGRGTMVIGGKRVPAGVGSVFEIERGVTHLLVVEGSVPAAAIVTFTPPYDGKDMIPVREE